MTPGQNRVLVLLLILALMESLIQPGVKSFFQNGWATINGALASSSSQLSAANQTQLKKNAGAVSAGSNGKCPPGYQMFGGVCMPNSVLGQI